MNRIFKYFSEINLNETINKIKLEINSFNKIEDKIIIYDSIKSSLVESLEDKLKNNKALIKDKELENDKIINFLNNLNLNKK